MVLRVKMYNRHHDKFLSNITVLYLHLMVYKYHNHIMKSQTDTIVRNVICTY